MYGAVTPLAIFLFGVAILVVGAIYLDVQAYRISVKIKAKNPNVRWAFDQLLRYDSMRRAEFKQTVESNADLKVDVQRFDRHKAVFVLVVTIVVLFPLVCQVIASGGCL